MACALNADGRQMLTASSDGTARLWDDEGRCRQVLKGHEGSLLGCSLSADGQRAITASADTIRFWAPDPADASAWQCALELHPPTRTVVWLDAETRTLKIKGPDWPFWQLSHADDTVGNLLGENIAEFGPMAHEQLANADDWQFLPRDDIQADAE